MYVRAAAFASVPGIVAKAGVSVKVTNIMYPHTRALEMDALEDPGSQSTYIWRKGWHKFGHVR